MVLAHLLFAYFSWHYTVALRQLFGVWKNFIWYIGHLFSVGLMVRTILSPWKRKTLTVGSIVKFEDFAAAITVNIMSRIVGFIIRVPIILTGLLIMMFMLVGLVVFYLFWLLLPLVVLALISTGLGFIYG